MSINQLNDMYAKDYPNTYKRTWGLTVDETNTQLDTVFSAIQVTFTGSTPVIVCVTPVEGEEINPVLIPFSGYTVRTVGS